MRLRKIILLSLVFLLSGVHTYISAQGISSDQRKILGSGVPYFDTENPCLATGGTSGMVPLDGENPERIFRFFLSVGLSAEQAAGIMGNINDESGFQPQRLQGTASGVITPADQVPRNQSAKAWGLVQWDRAHKMIDPVIAAGNDPNDLAVQLEFLWDQLEGKGPVPEKAAGDKVKAATTIEDAVRAFASYERFKDWTNPSNPKYTSRIAAARQAYDKFSGLAPSTGSGDSSSSSSCGTQSVGSGVNGVECPATMIAHPSREGYFKLPDAPNNEYDIYSRDSRRYGSRQLVCVLYTVALAYNKEMAGKSRLRIGDLNASGHSSHYRGIAVDLSGFGDIQTASHTVSWKGKYDSDATVKLGQMFIDTGTVRNIWWCQPSGDNSTEKLIEYASKNGGIEGQIKCISGHHNHFHIDIKLEYALEGRWEP